MRKLVLIAGLATALAVPAYTALHPTTADAQTSRCERNKQNNRIAGTVGGALVGALVGSAIDGGRNNTAGILVGGAAGGYAGNQLTKGHHPCPTGYTARSYNRSSYSRSSTRAVASTCHWETRSYRDGYGNLVRRQVEVCR